MTLKCFILLMKNSLFFQGMTFIHTSPLVFHGNLKSSNCVVTSRWMLQVILSLFFYALSCRMVDTAVIFYWVFVTRIFVIFCLLVYQTVQNVYSVFPRFPISAFTN